MQTVYPALLVLSDVVQQIKNVSSGGFGQE